MEMPNDDTIPGFVLKLGSYGNIRTTTLKAYSEDETSRPSVFAAGDVRSGAVKRVASAVGEGAMAVQFVHQYLRER